MPGKFCIQADWNDVPHLSEKVKAELYASIPPYQREARSKGIPSLGSGAIYPVSESDVTCAPFAIPDHWPRAWALDTGWNCTACVWGAWDNESGVLYVYDAYKRGQAEPPVHAEAIRSRGAWIRGVGDAAAINNYDGRQFIDIYRGLGLDIDLPDKAVEAGIQDVWQRMSAGKLKVFAHLKPWFEEFRLYRRDEKGHIVKENDHLMDATRYLVRSAVARKRTKPVDKPAVSEYAWGGGADGWMA